MNILVINLLCLLPVITEAAIIDPLFWFANKSDKPWSTYIRGAVMICLALLIDFELKDNFWWAALLLMVAYHFAIFGYFLNYLSGYRWDYLSDKGFDKYFGKLPIVARVGLQVWILLSALILYLTLNQTINHGAVLPFNLPYYEGY